MIHQSLRHGVHLYRLYPWFSFSNWKFSRQNTKNQNWPVVISQKNLWQNSNSWNVTRWNTEERVCQSILFKFWTLLTLQLDSILLNHNVKIFTICHLTEFDLYATQITWRINSYWNTEQVFSTFCFFNCYVRQISSIPQKISSKQHVIQRSVIWQINS